MTTPGLDVALAHAAKGRHVFPFRLAAKAGGGYSKTPLVRWTAEATTDPERIAAWWKEWPKARPGWKLEDGLLVADLDDAEAFAASGHALPDAPEQRTPSGGLHRLYAADGGRQTVKSIPGLDTRLGGKGWVGLYAADAFLGDPPPAPDWLLMEREPGVEHDFTELGTRQQITEWLGSIARAGQLTYGEALGLLHLSYDGGRIVDLDEANPWPPAFPALARSAAEWSRRDAPPPVSIRIRRPMRRPGARRRNGR